MSLKERDKGNVLVLCGASVVVLVLDAVVAYRKRIYRKTGIEAFHSDKTVLSTPSTEEIAVEGLVTAVKQLIEPTKMRNGIGVHSEIASPYDARIDEIAFVLDFGRHFEEDFHLALVGHSLVYPAVHILLALTDGNCGTASGS